MNPYNLLYSLIMKMIVVLTWIIFALFHISLIVIGLLVLWHQGITPETLESTLLQVYLELHQRSIFLALGFFGVPAIGLVYFYVKTWRRIFSRIMTPYILSDIENQIKKP